MRFRLLGSASPYKAALKSLDKCGLSGLAKVSDTGKLWWERELKAGHLNPNPETT